MERPVITTDLPANFTDTPSISSRRPVQVTLEQAKTAGQRVTRPRAEERNSFIVGEVLVCFDTNNYDARGAPKLSAVRPEKDTMS